MSSQRISGNRPTRVVLVRPHVDTIATSAAVPLGLYSVGFAAREELRSGIVVGVCDLRLHRLERSQLLAVLEDNDLVGISVSSTVEIIPALEIAWVAKQLGKKVVVGGMMATLNPDWFLRHPVVDYVVRESGEQALSDLVRMMRGEQRWEAVCNLSWVDRAGVIRHNNCTSSQPTIRNDAHVFLGDKYPDVYQEYLDRETYRWGETDLCMVEASLLSSVGCSLGCEYCTPAAAWGRRQHQMPPDVFVRDVVAISGLGVNLLNIRDEHFLLDPRRGLAVLESIAEAKSRGRMPGDTFLRYKARFENLTPEVLRASRRAGVCQVSVGIESPDSRTLKLLGRRGRHLSAEQVCGCLDRVLEHGIGVHALIILASPGETCEYLDGVIRFVEELGRRYTFEPKHVGFDKLTLFISFWTPHPRGGRFPLPSPDLWQLREDDLSYFTHITLVGLSPHITALQFAERYEVIVQASQSRRWNDPIPAASLEKMRAPPIETEEVSLIQCAEYQDRPQDESAASSTVGRGNVCIGV